MIVKWRKKGHELFSFLILNSEKCGYSITTDHGIPKSAPFESVVKNVLNKMEN